MPLPEYRVRESARARHVRLTVTARDGLVVVVPRGWRGDAGAIVASKRAWAERALSRVDEQRQALLAGAEALLPDRVELRAFGETYLVEYRESTSATVRVREEGPVLAVSGAVSSAEGCLAALRRWLDRTACERLTARIGELAATHGLAPGSVHVRNTRSRWGSCSARGAVMLARNAVFLPSHLLDALVLHELAHLRHMDHSPRFWAHLRELDGAALENRGELRQANDHVPLWARG